MEGLEKVWRTGRSCMDSKMVFELRIAIAGTFFGIWERARLDRDDEPGRGTLKRAPVWAGLAHTLDTL